MTARADLLVAFWFIIMYGRQSYPIPNHPDRIERRRERSRERRDWRDQRREEYARGRSHERDEIRDQQRRGRAPDPKPEWDYGEPGNPYSGRTPDGVHPEDYQRLTGRPSFRKKDLQLQLP